MISLAALVEDQRRAVEADLIDRNLRLRYLGEPWFTWSDFAAIVEWLPRDSAYVRATDPDAANYGVAEYALAQSVDALNHLVWFKTKDGSKGRNRPKPFPRPGVEDGTRKVRGAAVPMDEVKARLERARGSGVDRVRVTSLAAE